LAATDLLNLDFHDETNNYERGEEDWKSVPARNRWISSVRIQAYFAYPKASNGSTCPSQTRAEKLSWRRGHCARNRINNLDSMAPV